MLLQRQGESVTTSTSDMVSAAEAIQARPGRALVHAQGSQQPLRAGKPTRANECIDTVESQS